MSRETLTHLNSNVLIGFTEKRGNAWHYRANLQGGEPNHYPGAIPFQDVVRRLLNWQAESRPVLVQVPATLETATGLTPTGEPVRTVEVPTKQAIVRSDTQAVLGIFSVGYQIHQYEEWLLRQVSTLLGDSLAIGSAGLLSNGGKCWVSIEVPENVSTSQGVVFRPQLLTTTSHDGSISTTYKRVVTMVVCDNTRDMALGEEGQQVKIKHSRNSHLRLSEARDALNLIEQQADDFAAEVALLCAEKVTPLDWSKFLDAVADVKDKTGRGLTMAVTKRDALNRLWTHDERVSPWAGTAFGVVQAMNTYVHHEQIVRGSGRAERNMERAISGGVATLDRTTLATLRAVR